MATTTDSGDGDGGDDDDEDDDDDGDDDDDDNDDDDDDNDDHLSHCEISQSLKAARLRVTDLSEIWQVSRKHCCWDACQISERTNDSRPISGGFEISRDQLVRHIDILCIEVLTVNLAPGRW